MKKVTLVVNLILCCLAASAQQEAQFSQYIFNGLYINPAYAGYKEDLYMDAFFRSQWTGLDGSPTTVSLAADVAVNDGKVGLGIMLDHDELGAQSYLAAYGNYAYRLRIGENEHSKLAFGLGFGFIQNGLDGSKLSPAQSNDTFIPTGYESIVLPDARLGVYYSNDNFFIGASVDNILAKYVHTAEIVALAIPAPQSHEYFTTGALFTLDDQLKIKPSILIKDTQGAPTSMDINAFVLLSNRLWLGGTYRTSVDIYNKPNIQNGLQKSSAMVGVAEFYISDTFRVGYSFDYALNALGSYGYGSHELSISLMLRSNPLKDRTRNCYF